MKLKLRLKLLASTCALALLSACALIPSRPGIKMPAATVQAPKDAGTPATVHTSEAGTAVPLPVGSVVTVTEIAAQPAAAPDVPPVPASKITVITPGAATEYRHNEAATAASTGTIDTTVAKHRIDVESRRWLLFVAIACGIAGLVVKSLLPEWPGLSNGLLIAAPIAFAAWKLADVPSWLWAVALGIVALLALGYKRAEWDRDGDGIPDALQSKIENPGHRAGGATGAGPAAAGIDAKSKIP